MAVDRKLMKESFSIDGLPAWPCPACARGHLTLLKNFPPTTLGSADSRRLPIEDYDYNVEKYHGVVAVIAKCSSSRCEEAFSISGRFHTVRSFDDFGNEISLEMCRPVAITPSIHPIKIPAGCPATVQEELVAAFSLMWLDASAALNRVRTSIEVLMDHYSIPKLTIRKQVDRLKVARHKRIRLGLHQRIELLGEKRTSVKDIVPALLAIKYLGNEGTHGSTATLDDLFDALDVSEALLARLFDPNHVTTEQIVNEVLKKKGSRRQKKA